MKKPQNCKTNYAATGFIFFYDDSQCDGVQVKISRRGIVNND